MDKLPLWGRYKWVEDHLAQIVGELPACPQCLFGLAAMNGWLLRVGCIPHAVFCMCAPGSQPACMAVVGWSHR